MEIQQARRLVKDSLFDLIGYAVPDHLWGLIPLSDVGVDSEFCPVFLIKLGLEWNAIKFQ